MFVAPELCSYSPLYPHNTRPAKRTYFPSSSDSVSVSEEDSEEANFQPEHHSLHKISMEIKILKCKMYDSKIRWGSYLEDGGELLYSEQQVGDDHCRGVFKQPGLQIDLSRATD
ncbi:hypothetical protein WMY93_019495 [Mugilogobius chulae]|uniref:Uncharacterized protein n=1 Tax=Mugilogobius chulae TaxID=88201 RepID=A0AAW0NIZ6_9GOBI